MQSHFYEFSASECVRAIVRPLLPVAVFVMAMHLGAWSGWFPAPRPTLDVDRTILVQKAEASRAAQDAEIVLLGDSSCLMDVSAPRLSKRLGRPVLNLGTLSYLDLSANARLLRNYAQANPGQLRAVVLLMHPEGLRLAHVDTWQEHALYSFLAGADFQPRERLADWVAGVLGADIFHGRLLARVLPRPLRGPFGCRYGFTEDLENYLKQNRGSAVDPESKPATGRAEYWLASYLKPASEGFRQAVPAGVKLYVVITPLPERFAGPAYPARYGDLLRQWSDWLKADAALKSLPAVLSDSLFAQKTHLNAAGQLRYTELMAQALESQLH